MNHAQYLGITQQEEFSTKNLNSLEPRWVVSAVVRPQRVKRVGAAIKIRVDVAGIRLDSKFGLFVSLIPHCSQKYNHLPLSAIFGSVCSSGDLNGIGGAVGWALQNFRPDRGLLSSYILLKCRAVFTHKNTLTHIK